jgi:diaminopropionate ammonia-lyase family
MPAFRRPVFHNTQARSWKSAHVGDHSDVTKFHQQLPDYEKTPLIKVSELAKELGVAAVYVKAETSRLGLPSFKILGASWGTYKALLQYLQLPYGSRIDEVKEALAKTPVSLYAATDGNHGRAVARMGSIFGITAHIYVPRGVDAKTVSLIREESATVIESASDYDKTIEEAQRAAHETGSLLIQDFAFEGYEDIPQVCLSISQYQVRAG